MRATTKKLKKHWWVVGLLLAIVMALLSPLASPHPDGLVRLAQDKGFAGKAREATIRLIPDYLFPGIENGAVARTVAGVVGTLGVFGLGYGVAWLLRRRSERRAG